MNTVTLKQEDGIEVSVKLFSEMSLSDLLPVLEGMIKTLGYCFDGRLDIVLEDDVVND